MKRADALIAALLLSLAVPTAPGVALAQGRGQRGDNRNEEKSLNLGVGESKAVPATDVKQYSEGTPGIADIKLTPDGKRFIISGLKAGTTSLLLIKNDGSQLTWIIKIYSQAPDEVENELAQLLEGYTGIRIRKIGSRLFIEGGVQHESDLNRIKQVADLYPGQVESLVTVGTGAVDRNLNVRLDFFFVQYNKNSSYGVGLSWPGRIGGEGVLQSTFTFDLLQASDTLTTAQASIVNQPLPSLDLAAAKGWAKVLKQSAVMTINGNEASFSSGGELNFPVVNATNSSIQTISFGMLVAMQPRFDPRTGNIEIKLSADVSDIVPSQGSPLPGRQATKLSTVVFLKLGESLVLSGIKAVGRRHQVIGLPLLSQIPVLGVFFGSHTDQIEEVEGAMFIIPSVVESVPKSSYDMVKEAMTQYEDYSGDLDEVNAFPKAPPAYGSTEGSQQQPVDDGPKNRKKKK